MFSREKILKGFKWAGIILLALFVILVVIRIPHVLEVEKTNEQVAKIHATKLTLADVMGDNLPPDPGAEADKTLAGIDVNANGVRDDVELAIFKEYPDSPKIRAALLQYALALQMEFIQPLVNKGTVTAVAEEESNAYQCLGDELVPRKNPNTARSSADFEKIQDYLGFVEHKQFNTKERDTAQDIFYEGNLGNEVHLTRDCGYGLFTELK